MNRVGEFEKVSFEQFRIAMDDAFHDIGYTEDELREIWEATPLPVRATSGSAGYAGNTPRSPEDGCYAEYPDWAEYFPRSSSRSP